MADTIEIALDELVEFTRCDGHTSPIVSGHGAPPFRKMPRQLPRPVLLAIPV